MDVPRLRKMDVSPPTFEGAIDGIKLNSFLFQFESYFQQKGYSLAQHDHILPRELNQCVRKNALIWYERYMTDDMTTKLWGVMKMGLDELTAINVFVNGLTNNQMKVAIQRKQPTTLTAAVHEGFLEWELQDKPAANNQYSNDYGGSGKKPNGGKQKRSSEKVDHRGKNSGENPRRTTTTPGTLCSHCSHGVHQAEDCWVLHPEKKPHNLQRKQQLHSKIYALLESLDFADEQNRSSNSDDQLN
ncbi:hypothetical protein PF003_g25813 [Phytophthora fragariae]|nr:hypothetical protein PF003_g25813 [Phytophthora fragariae]